MKLFLKHKLLTLYILLNLIAAMLMVLNRSNFVFNLQSIYALGVYPIQSATKSVSRAFVYLYTSITDIFTLQGQVQVLKDRIAELSGAALEYEQLSAENDRLRALLNEAPTDEYALEYAEIVSKDPQNFYTTIVINKGSAHGIVVGMPVISYQNGYKGLVGKVVEVRRYNSRILSLVDQRSQISVMLESSRTTGIMVGQSPKSTQTHLQYIDLQMDVEEGERVVTSGMGGVFPKGILVGTIFKVEKKNYGLFHDLYVEPTVNFSTLENVYVIKKVPDQEIIMLANEEDENNGETK
ncbi:rod shape-determining protein MreC [Brachyspira innocens]|uniref:Cell shape-determining protein MreC n=1 Tax=Brachyspira innocens TaxID=13264 RepID=A0ABT8YXF2_9SPIR|nr:rod shape-determining protein MreC [Brachyspira innocens]MDO6993836.1 rod shape-determining protein MreC [Brachyspira innocens]MDO7019819.1 rod shape-determining protein MreC [Brachyspira innocens]